MEAVELFHYDVVFDKDLTVSLVWIAPVESPAWGDCVFVEGAKDWLFDLVGDGHIILDGVQPPQHEVKYADLTNFETRAVVNLWYNSIE